MSTAATEMHSQAEMVACAYCAALFHPKRRWEAFCKPSCRSAFNVDIGASGRVVSVRRLKRGVSLILHLDGPAGEAGLNLKVGDTVRAVRRP